MQGVPGHGGRRRRVAADIVMLALTACTASTAIAGQSIQPPDPALEDPLGAWRDPARQHHAGFLVRTDLESILRPHGLAPDFLDGDCLFPYRWRLVRGGGLSRWRHASDLRLRFGPLAGAAHGGLLGAVEPPRWPRFASRRPGPYAPAGPTLRIDLLETRLDVRVPLPRHDGYVALTGIRSTLPAFGDQAPGASIVVPEVQDAGFHVETQYVALSGSRSKEDVTRTPGANGRDFDDLGVDVHADNERAGVELRPPAGRAPALRVDQEYDRERVRIVDTHGRRVADVAARRTRTRLEIDGGDLLPADGWRWSPGLTLLDRRERLGFERDDVPQHRFPSPPSMALDEAWREGAVWLALTRLIADAALVEAYVRAGAHSGYQGTGWTSGVRVADRRRLDGWQLTVEAAAGHRYAFPGIEAMLTRTLPIDLGAASERRPETAWSGVAEIRLEPDAGAGAGIVLHASHARLTRIWVPADRITYVATTGEGQSSQFSASATSRPFLGAVRAGGTYAWTAARLEGGAYGSATQPAGEVEHRGSLWLAWRQRPWLTWSAAWQSLSGLATTPVVGRIPVAQPDFEEVLPVMGALDSERLPARHRLDVGVAVARRNGPVDWTARVEVLNAADRLNPIAWRWNGDFTRRQADGMLPRIVNVELAFTLRRSESRPPIEADPP